MLPAGAGCLQRRRGAVARSAASAVSRDPDYVRVSRPVRGSSITAMASPSAADGLTMRSWPYEVRIHDEHVEFRCRLATADRAQIIEGVYVADSEARPAARARGEGPVRPVLRAARSGFGGSRPGCRGGRIKHARVPRLQPGAGDAAQGRHAAGAVARHPARATSPTRSSRRCSTTSTRRCGRARRCRTPSRRTATCSRASTPRRCWPASAAATSSGAAPLRRLREGHQHGAAARRSRRWSIRRS